MVTALFPADLEGYYNQEPASISDFGIIPEEVYEFAWAAYAALAKLVAKSIYSRKYAQFLNLLIEARKGANLTQVEVASRLGRPQSFVSKYENGERRLDVVEFLNIAKVVEFDPVKLIRKLSS